MRMDNEKTKELESRSSDDHIFESTCTVLLE